MTIETQISQVAYEGNGVTRIFPVPFPVYRSEHVRMYRRDNGGNVVQVTADYYIQGAGGDAVTVTYPVAGSPMSAGEILTICRRVPLVQSTDLENGGAFDAEVIERQFDLVVMQIQQVNEDLGRALTVSIGSDAPDRTVERILADMAAIAARAEDALFQAQNIVQGVTLGKGVTNLRGTWRTSSALAAGDLLRLPAGYYPGRQTLLLMYDGLVCHPAGSDVPAELPQYEDIGPADVLSRDVRLLFDAPAGAVWSAWVVASNVSQHQEDLTAAAERAALDAQARAGEAAASAMGATGSMATAQTQAGVATASAAEAGRHLADAQTVGAGVAADAALARKWAENPHDSPVEPGAFSAKHWAEEAAGVVSGGIPVASPAQKGLVPSGGAAGWVYRVNAAGNGYGWEDFPKVEFATTAETAAGAVTGKATTPVGVKAAIEAHAAAYAPNSDAPGHVRVSYASAPPIGEGVEGQIWFQLQ